MSALELAAVISPLCTIVVAYVGRARLQAVETRVDGHLDALQLQLVSLQGQLAEARRSAADLPADESGPSAVPG